ncbi:unnamed protein product [Ranitomeya imitator]|uniref:NXPE C-terminal domain-containing protein n=1 Tax=Ranitomeya imitator TaxID=111125 RepID=A0ABN9MMC5_9NEOB|nr:unnamed protein product [Ranitomeya imitator]
MNIFQARCQTASKMSLYTAQGLTASPDPDHDELQRLMRLIEWPEAPNGIDFMSSTSPKTTYYEFLHPQETYQVGDQITVLIFALDHYGRPKTYGGDYFQAKLHSLKLKAGVTGAVTDHRNGSYSATFLLLWPGDAEVYIALVHSSEAISILRKKRRSRPDKIHYHGYFSHNGSSAMVECNVLPPGPDVCTYRDSRQSNEEWFCTRPEGFPCSAYREHSAGDRSPILNANEQLFLHSKSAKGNKCTAHAATTLSLFGSQFSPAATCPSRDLVGHRSDDFLNSYKIERTSPDLQHGRVWQSRVCRNRLFPTPSNVTSCLKGKVIYMLGDSTLRQWWEYLVNFVPCE